MKKIVRIAIGFLLAGMIAHAQNPQTQIAPIYAVNAKYTNGVAPGYYPTKGSGLVLNVGPGTANCAGTMITYAGGTFTLAASSTNYIYLNTSASCAPATKTTAFTSSDIPLAVAVAGSSSVTLITDDRTMFFPAGSGTGITQLTGDIACGPGSGSQVCTLPTVNSSPGTCGDATHVCQVTVNGKGLTTAQTQVTISGGSGSINVNGLSVSSPNFNNASPAPSASLYAPVPWQVSGSNVIATYPGNPPNTLYVFAGNSINQDDNQELGPLITVTTWSANGTTCSFNNSGTNGFVAGDWISTGGVTGWPGGPYAGGIGNGNGYTLFQISSSGLTSSAFTFACPLISATSGSGGTVEKANAWLPFQTDSLLPAGERGTPLLRVLSSATIVGLASSYSTFYHSLSPAVTGNPAYLVINNGLNDYISCSSAATIEAAYHSIFSQAHTDGWYVVVGSTTPDALRTNGCNTINAIMVATENWLYAQGPTQSNLATGAYWDYFVDVRGVLTNARDSSLMDQTNFTLAAGGAIIMSQMFAQVLHTHQSIFMNKRGDIWAGLPNANSSFTSDNGFAHFLPNVGSGHAESWWDAAYANEYMGFNTTNARVEFPIGVGFGSANQLLVNGSGDLTLSGCAGGTYLHADGTGCGIPAVGLSGMTATQVAIAGSATTITGSKPVAGSGAAFPTGPSSSTSGDCVNFNGTFGQIADAGAPCGTGSGTTPSVTFNLATGVVGVPAAPYLVAPVGGIVSNCYFTTLTSDASTNLIFNVKFNGTNIISGTNATVSAGTSPGTVSNFSLTSGTISITQGQKWELDISTGAADWTGAMQCY